MRHELEAAVLQIQFLLNEGALITATTDDSLHLWNFRQKRPEIVHSLKFQKDRLVNRICTIFARAVPRDERNDKKFGYYDDGKINVDRCRR